MVALNPLSTGRLSGTTASQADTTHIRPRVSCIGVVVGKACWGHGDSITPHAYSLYAIFNQQEPPVQYAQLNPRHSLRAKPCHAKPCCALLRFTVLYHAMLYYALLCWLAVMEMHALTHSLQGCTACTAQVQCTSCHASWNANCFQCMWPTVRSPLCVVLLHAVPVLLPVPAAQWPPAAPSGAQPQTGWGSGCRPGGQGCADGAGGEGRGGGSRCVRQHILVSMRSFAWVQRKDGPGEDGTQELQHP